MAPQNSDLFIEKLSGGYASTLVVEDLSLNMAAGEKLGVLGRNGVGKSTLLACIMGLAVAHQGRVIFGDLDITHRPTWQRARAGLGYVPQTRDIFKSLSVEENLLSAARTEADEARVATALELFPRLRERRNNRGTQLSGGEQQMLAVARAIISGPQLLLMDEPLEGLAPRVRDELMDAINNMIESVGMGCILVEQHVDVVLEFAETVLILERGKSVFYGATQVLLADSAILEQTVGLRKAANH